MGMKPFWRKRLQYPANTSGSPTKKQAGIDSANGGRYISIMFETLKSKDVG
jgi:hypothetical protein